jgi:hypothetical protein
MRSALSTENPAETAAPRPFSGFLRPCLEPRRDRSQPQRRATPRREVRNVALAGYSRATNLPAAKNR